MVPSPVRLMGFCPMGCGETLFMGAGGHITCSKLRCPRPTAVDELLAENLPEHVVEFTDVDFTIKHPMHERLDNGLFRCGLLNFIQRLSGPPVRPGAYVARHNGERWTWEELPK